jgi:hypothetical protein
VGQAVAAFYTAISLGEYLFRLHWINYPGIYSQYTLDISVLGLGLYFNGLEIAIIEDYALLKPIWQLGPLWRGKGPFFILRPCIFLGCPVTFALFFQVI